MAEHSRRKFLTYSSVAMVGAVGAVPIVAVATDASAANAGPSQAGPVVAVVRDHRSGEITLMAGEHEITCHDKALAARLSQLAATARS